MPSVAQHSRCFFEGLLLDVMGPVMVPPILQLLGKLCAIGFIFTVQGSTGDNISPTPAFFSDMPPIQGMPGPQLQPFRSSAPASESLSTGSNLHPPLALPPFTSAPVPQKLTGHLLHPHLIKGMSHLSHQMLIEERQQLDSAPVSVSSAPAAAPPRQSPENSTVSQSNAPEASLPSSHKKDVSFSGAPVPNSVSPAASPSRKPKENQPAVPPIAPATMPSAVPVVSPTHPVMPGESPAMLSGFT
ncbi:hypothetical protein OIU77_006113 [Salix suchowensis]|uniref:Uncharacterized protein n=1 Tax=Salix suchowensis TaxID=1278906 RepID=A0ABQ9ASX6_9ROSI|nr:hypothetical protein OIU77_006113 [Salix suchowensis]